MNFALNPLLFWALAAAAAAVAAIRLGILAYLKKAFSRPDPEAKRLSKLYFVSYDTALQLLKFGILKEPGYEKWRSTDALRWKDRRTGNIQTWPNPILPDRRRPSRQT
jgi:hypothetical protein